MQEIADYRAYVWDVAGTIIPIEFFSYDIKEYGLRNVEKIAEKAGKTGQEVREILEKGSEALAKGDKENPFFKQFPNIAELVQEIGFGNDDLDVPSFGDAASTIDKIGQSTARQYIFSSGNYNITKREIQKIKVPFTGRTLDMAIGDFYSTSDSEGRKGIGGKTKPESYALLAQDLIAKGVVKSAIEICYVTDTRAEAEAALKAGFGRAYLYDLKDNGSMPENGMVTINRHRDVLSTIREYERRHDAPVVS
jgi:methionine salvage enolase-phosphatase E1